MKTTITAPAANGRSYNSPLRDRQSERTRELILEALASELAEGGLHDLNIPAIAQRAGVSVRTVYRYFPTRDALIDAAEERIDRIVGPPHIPQTAADLPGMAQALFRQFDDRETLILAHWATDLGRDVRARGRRRRLQAYLETLSAATANLTRSDARAAHAVISHLLSSLTWKTLREEFGMKGSESGKAVAWALRTLIDDVKHRNEQAKPAEAAQAER